MSPYFFPAGVALFLSRQSLPFFSSVSLEITRKRWDRWRDREERRLEEEDRVPVMWAGNGRHYEQRWSICSIMVLRYSENFG